MRRNDGRFSPVLGVTLLGLWLLLNQSASPGQIALGALLAGLLTLAAATLRPLRSRLRRLDVAVLLFFVVMKDVVVSNFNVARIVLGLTGGREIRSGFLRIPLDLTDPHGLAALAVILTATPGTVWSGLSESGDALTLHVLDLKDEAELIRLVKEHYERPLLRIFQ